MPLLDDGVKVAEALLYRERVRDDFLTFCKHVLAEVELVPQKHHLLMIKHLQWVADTPNARLMIFMPPGHGKSIYTSVFFPAWYMATKERKVIGASYNADLAERFSAFARRTIMENAVVLDYNLRDDSRGRERWETTNGGEYRCAGMQAGITGFRADTFIIDDPHRNLEEVYSPAMNQKVWDIYTSDIISRMRGKGKIVLIQTRWAENDLAGRILEVEAGKWKILRLPAIAEENDPLNRAVGEALWPEEHPLERLENNRKIMGEKLFAALYQGKPQPDTGNLIKVEQLQRRIINAVPVERIKSTIRAWDIAAGIAATADYTVGLKLARLDNDSYVVMDVVRFRGEPHDVEEVMVGTAHLDTKATKISLPIDPGASGKAAVLYLTRALRGYHVESTRESGDKALRAMGVASQIAVGNVSLAQGDWNGAFLAEAAAFPSGKHDDCIDALSRAFNGLMDNVKPAQFSRINWMSR